MLIALALLACTDPAEHLAENAPVDNPEVIPEVAEVVSLPTGRAIFRSSCFEQDKGEDTSPGWGGPGTSGHKLGGGVAANSMNYPPPPSGAPGEAAKAPSGPAPVVTASSPQAAPESAATGSAQAAKPAATGSAQAAKPSTTPKASTEVDRAPAKREAAADGYGLATRAPAEEAEASMDAIAEATARPEPRSSLDWGATVFLSNDDSMSLASAQKLIDALKRGSRIQPSQIRPHELLNYFSFQTPEVPRRETFAVSGAAARTGDSTLSVAFTVQGATPPRRPLDLTVVVDRSGSMSAEGRMEYLKRGLHQMEGQLKRGDRVDVVLFDHDVCNALEDYVVGRDDAALLTQTIDRMTPRGSTDLDAGLREGYRLAGTRDGHGREQRVMLITDAQLNTGNVDPHLVSEVARHFEEKKIRLTGVGVGRDFRDDVLDRLTEKGKGAYVFLGSELVVDRIFGSGFASLTQTIAHDVHFALDLPESLAMERFYGEEISVNKEDVQPIHYYAGTSQVFLQDLKVDPARIQPSDPIELEITWTDPATGEPAKKRYPFRIGDLTAAPPVNLDKARALMAWTDLLSAAANRQDACGEPLALFQTRAALVQNDPEIQFISGLVSKSCPRFTLAPPVPTTVPVKVKVSADTSVQRVELRCAGTSQVQSISPSDSVARFEATPGACALLLEGAGTWSTSVTVPAVAAEIRCSLRGGALSCQ